MHQHLERIESCHPILHEPVRQLVHQCQSKLGRTLLIVWGHRSYEHQLSIYQQGRTYNRESGVWEVTDERAVKTKAKPGLSAHNIVTLDGQPASMAVDVIPFNADGSLDWNVSMVFWNRLYVIAHKLGLDPLGDQVGAYLKGDLGHFQEPGWEIKLGALNAKRPTEPTVQI